METVSLGIYGKLFRCAFGLEVFVLHRAGQQHIFAALQVFGAAAVVELPVLIQQNIAAIALGDGQRQAP